MPKQLTTTRLISCDDNKPVSTQPDKQSPSNVTTDLYEQENDSETLVLFELNDVDNTNPHTNPTPDTQIPPLTHTYTQKHTDTLSTHT